MNILIAGSYVLWWVGAVYELDSSWRHGLGKCSTLFICCFIFRSMKNKIWKRDGDRICSLLWELCSPEASSSAHQVLEPNELIVITTLFFLSFVNKSTLVPRQRVHLAAFSIGHLHWTKMCIGFAMHRSWLRLRKYLSLTACLHESTQWYSDVIHECLFPTVTLTDSKLNSRLIKISHINNWTKTLFWVSWVLKSI